MSLFESENDFQSAHTIPSKRLTLIKLFIGQLNLVKMLTVIEYL